MKDRILKLLGAGINVNLVASAVGCDHAYISHLMADEEFALEVAKLRCKDLEIEKERDGRYSRIHDKLLEKLEHLLPMMLRPREIIHALQVVNQERCRAEALTRGVAPLSVTHNIVVLQLPTKTINTFELSAKNEVISVEGQQLIPMSTPALMKELSIQNLLEEAQHANERNSQEAAKAERLSEKILSHPERYATADSV